MFDQADGGLPAKPEIISVLDSWVAFFVKRQLLHSTQCVLHATMNLPRLRDKVGPHFIRVQNASMVVNLNPQDARRRVCMLALLPWLPWPAMAVDASWREAMSRAEALRNDALRAGDQPYGAVVLRAGVIVGAAPSRVVTANDPTAHAEMEAIRDAARRLRTRDLSGCLLVSTSRPCRMCEAAATWAGISRMVYGEFLTDGGEPR